MIRGRAHKFGNNIDTDAIIPATYANLTDPAELGRHCMEHIDPGFAQRVSAGDIIVGGSNFGCGSSREIAPWAIRGSGISCVIARSFARIFFRNAINIALPLLECPAAAEGGEAGDLLEIDLLKGEVRNLSRGKVFQAAPYPDFIRELVCAGGLVEYARRLLEQGIGPSGERGR
ncbi:MAG: 3-isopropylmalate dehydratase small subunit [Syntrophaceae bacterium]|nr:3-isopropylmalate dehydratase small subunit [Syntrophaceae bacterium]